MHRRRRTPRSAATIPQGSKPPCTSLAKSATEAPSAPEPPGVRVRLRWRARSAPGAHGVGHLPGARHPRGARSSDDDLFEARSGRFRSRLRRCGYARPLRHRRPPVEPPSAAARAPARAPRSGRARACRARSAAWRPSSSRPCLPGSPSGGPSCPSPASGAQPELVAEREIGHRQIRCERSPALSQLVQPCLRGERDASLFDPGQRLGLPALVGGSSRLRSARVCSGSWTERPVWSPALIPAVPRAPRVPALRCASVRRSSASAVTHASGSNGSRLIEIPPTWRSRKPSTRSPSRAGVAAAAEIHPQPAHALLAATQQAPAVALDMCVLRQGLLQLARQHLQRDPQVGAVRAQARRGEVEVLLGRHGASVPAAVAIRIRLLLP